MKMTQIHELANLATSEALGRENVLLEDLSNLVDTGTEIFDSESVDHYVKSLVNHIGRVIFVNRVYRGSAPSVLMDGWEYGSVCEKIIAELPEAQENESWELEDGTSYDQNIFYKPVVSAKFFNKRVTFEIPMSFTEKQVKQSFSSAEQLNAFISMIYTAVENSMTVKLDALIMRTINHFTAETVEEEYGSDDFGSKSGVRAVNLLYLYNTYHPTATITATDALTDPDFIKFAAYQIGLYTDRMSRISSLFNIGGKERFTPKENMHLIMLSDFEKAANVFLQSGTFHEEYTALPNAETVPYWQGSGEDYNISSTSAINVKTASNNTVEMAGILCVIFDRNALGVCNIDRRVTTHYNAKAEFFNNFYKFDAGYFNDFNENFVVFFIADEQD